MFSTQWRRAALAVLLAAVATAPAPAADTTPPDVSAKLVPVDAPFYGAWLRNREQVEAFLNSRAFAELKTMPAVQMLWGLAQQQVPQAGQLDDLRKQYENSPFKESGDVLLDALSHEVFVYGGATWGDFADLTVRLMSAVRYGPMFAQLSGQAKGLDPGQMQTSLALGVLKDNVNLIKVPDLVLGFKVSDAKKAKAQVDKLEQLLAGAAEQTEELKGRVKRARIGGGDFVTLELDGKLVPWDRVPFKDFEEKPGDLDALAKKLKALRLTVSVGVRDGYLLLAVGESTAALTKLNGPGKRLTDLAEFKPLLKHAGERLTSVAYASKGLRARMETTGEDVNDTLKMLRSAVPASALTEEQGKKLAKHAEELAKDWKSLLPKSGASLSFSYLTDRGYEGYAHDWSTPVSADGSKSLTLLDHLGGRPVLAVVGRAKYDPAQYALLVKWVKIVYEYAEEVGVPRLEDEQKKQFEEWSKALKPLAKRLDDVTAKMLLPALADGQSALVLDAKWTSKEWFKGQPAPDKPLPMIEPALVVGVSDADLLEKAVAGYRSIVADFLAKARELAPGQVPEFEFPKAKARTAKDGKFYSWPLPAEAGLDARVAPTAGLGTKVAVLALSEGHAERLLTATPLKVQSKVLADAGTRPLAGLTVFDWPALVDAVAPWVEYGVVESVKARAGGNEEDGKKAAEAILANVRPVVRLLKAFRGSVSVTYVEDGALVTHSETVFRDVSAPKGR